MYEKTRIPILVQMFSLSRADFSKCSTAEKNKQIQPSSFFQFQTTISANDGLRTRYSRAYFQERMLFILRASPPMILIRGTNCACKERNCTRSRIVAQCAFSAEWVSMTVSGTAIIISVSVNARFRYDNGGLNVIGRRRWIALL